MKKEKNILTKYFIVELCAIFLLVASIFMWFQPFVISDKLFGSTGQFSLTGYEMVFGATTKINIITPGGYATGRIVFSPSNEILISLVFLYISLFLQIVSIPLRQNKKVPYIAWQIINGASVVTCLTSSILVFFSVKLYSIANPENLSFPFLSSGCILTGIFTMFTSLILFINFFKDKYKKEQKVKNS